MLNYTDNNNDDKVVINMLCLKRKPEKISWKCTESYGKHNLIIYS